MDLIFEKIVSSTGKEQILLIFMVVGISGTKNRHCDGCGKES